MRYEYRPKGVKPARITFYHSMDIGSPSPFIGFLVQSPRDDAHWLAFDDTATPARCDADWVRVALKSLGLAWTAMWSEILRAVEAKRA